MSHRGEDRVSQLSAGLRRRLAVISGMAPAIMCEAPRIVFLDEPSEGLDSFSKGVLKKWISELSQYGNTIVMASHDEEIIACSSRILTIESGEISESKNTIEEGFTWKGNSLMKEKLRLFHHYSGGVTQLRGEIQ